MMNRKEYKLLVEGWRGYINEMDRMDFYQDARAAEVLHNIDIKKKMSAKEYKNIDDNAYDKALKDAEQDLKDTSNFASGSTVGLLLGDVLTTKVLLLKLSAGVKLLLAAGLATFSFVAVVSAILLILAKEALEKGDKEAAARLMGLQKSCIANIDDAEEKSGIENMIKSNSSVDPFDPDLKSDEDLIFKFPPRDSKSPETSGENQRTYKGPIVDLSDF